LRGQLDLETGKQLAQKKKKMRAAVVVAVEEREVVTQH
jgi:hypothetical protein